jgi:hypothetical protein
MHRNSDETRMNEMKEIEIILPDGVIVYLSKGSKITDIKVIAGKGRDRAIDEIDMLVSKFGGNPFEWQKMKGMGYIDYNGESEKVELHWYEEPSIGIIKMKVKPQKGGTWYVNN